MIYLKHYMTRKGVGARGPNVILSGAKNPRLATCGFFAPLRMTFGGVPCILIGSYSVIY